VESQIDRGAGAPISEKSALAVRHMAVKSGDVAPKLIGPENK
jgi:hypothetical protein